MQTSFFTTAAQSFTSNEQLLQTLEQELESGNAVSTASANPAAFVGATGDTDDVGQLTAEDSSQTNIQTTLGLGTTALSEAATILDKIQQTALEAINGTVNSSEFQSLSGQVQQNLQQLIAVADTADNNGDFVFAGTAGNIKPFVQNSSGSTEYFGNDGISTVEVSPGITVNAALSGTAFTGGFSGDGFASVAAASGNTGTATFLPVGILNDSSATQFQQGSKPITISFSTNASGQATYTATQGSATISSGPAKPGEDITLDGVQFELSGTPASGDNFTIAPARPQSVFALIQGIQNALATPGTTAAEHAQTAQVLGNALAGITQYQNIITSENARIGVILQTVSNAQNDNAQAITTDQNDAANLTSANVPQLLTEIDEQTTALQAALQAFGVTQGLDVFNFL
ncbi:MAG TPA: flagellar hook-associated protein FlgL [Acetobacteraceae bacterium]|nr:flagellar hook-associated protein FlgL [Acetobacteraceae bacterium]